MLNHKKNYTWLYVLGALVVVALAWAISQEMPFNEEVVEEPLENTFAK